MLIDKTTGWLEDARRVPSPNHDERPLGAVIDLIVVHGISLPPGEYGNRFIDELFINRLNPEAHPYFQGVAGLRVSAHVLIDREGKLTQYVPFHRRAWHAGLSEFLGRSCCNDFSIGIELEGFDDDPYEEGQYWVLARLIQKLVLHWPAISPDRVVGHSDISPGRKTDPGPAFSWNKLKTLLNNQIIGY